MYLNNLYLVQSVGVWFVIQKFFFLLGCLTNHNNMLLGNNVGLSNNIEILSLRPLVVFLVVYIVLDKM